MSDSAGLNERLPMPQQGGAGLDDPTPQQPPMTMRERTESILGLMDRGMTQPQAAAALGLDEPAIGPAPQETAPAPADDGVPLTDQLWTATRQFAEDATKGLGGIYDRVTGDGDLEGTGSEFAESIGPTAEQERVRDERIRERQQAYEDGDIGYLRKTAGELGDAIKQEAAPTIASVGGGAAARWAAKKSLPTLLSLVPGVSRKMADKAAPWISNAIGLSAALAPQAGRMYQDKVQKAVDQGLDINDPDVQNNIDLAAGIGTVTNLVPIGRMLRFGGPAAEKVQSKMLGMAAEGGKLFGMEAVTELLDLATTEALLDEETRDKWDDLEWAEFSKYAWDRYKQEALIAGLAGGTVGGSIGAVQGLTRQGLINERAKQDTRTLAQTMEPLGLGLPEIEKLARTPEGLKTLREATEAVGLGETMRRQQKRLAKEAGDPEFEAAVAQDVDAKADEIIDEQAKKLGAPMRTKDLRKAQEDRAKAQRNAAAEKLRARGQALPEDVDETTATQVANRLDKAEAAVEEKRARADAITNPERKAEAQRELDEANEEARAARVEAKMKLEGKTYDQASSAIADTSRREAQRAGRERAIARQSEIEFPETMPEAERVARAREIVAEDEAKPRDDKGLDNKIKRLTRQRRAATSDEDIDRLSNEIADLEARRGLPAPVAEAARRVLQASGEQSPIGAEESSPGADTASAGTADGQNGVTAPDTARSQPVGAAAALDAGPDVLGDLLPGVEAQGNAAFDGALASIEKVATGKATPSDFESARRALGPEAEQQSDSQIRARATETLRRATDQAQNATATADSATATAVQRAARRAPDTSGYDLPDGTKYRDLTSKLGPNEDLYEFMRKQSEDGIEVAAHVRDGDPLAVGTNDNPNLVMPPKAGFADPDVTFVHTHTENTPFSAADVRAMLHSGQPFVALLPNGENIAMSPKGEYNAKSEALINDLFTKIGARAPRHLGLKDRARVRQEALLQLLEVNGNINYDRPLNDLSEPHMEIVNGIVSDLEATLPGDGARVDAGAGPAKAGPVGGQPREARTEDQAGPSVTAEDGTFLDPDSTADDVEAEFSDVGSGGILENQSFGNSRRDKRPSFNRERVRQLAADTLEARIRRGNKTEWFRDYRNGDLTLERIEAGLMKAISLHGFKKAMVLPEVVREMYPDMKLTPDDFAKMKRKQSGSSRDDDEYYPLIDASKERKFKAALELTNDVRYSGHGAFGRQMDDLVKGRLEFQTAFLEASPDLREFVEFKFPEDVQFMPPVPDPSDVSRIKRQPRQMRFSEDAMKPLERTAKYLQENQYTINKEKLYALTPDDLISSKAYGKWGFKPSDVPYLDELLASDKRWRDWPDEAKKKFNWGGVKLFKSARRTAEYKLAQIRSAYSDFVAQYGEDAKTGFLYQVDSRGRIYADGSFHPQAGSKIKALFEHEGTSLGDYVEVDNSASGWQINALIARDDVAAPKLNMGAGQALEPGFEKADLYTDTLENLRPLLKRDAEVDVSQVTGVKARREAARKKRVAKMFLDGPFRDDVDLKTIIPRASIKPPIIAQNYGGKRKGFSDTFQATLKPYVNVKNSLEANDRPWGYITDLGLEALGQVAPKSISFKNWAIDAIAKTVEAVEAGTSKTDPPRVEISIGMDGRFAAKRHATIPGFVRARSKAGGQLAFKMKGKTGRPELDENGKMIPLLDGKGEQLVKEDSVEIPLQIKRDHADPQKTARAYFANIIQSLDAAVLHRAVERYKQVTGGAFVTTNHDSYTVPPEHEGAIAASVRESMATIMTEVDVPARLYADLKSAAALHGVEVDIEPFADMGSYNMDDLNTSTPLFGEAPGRPDDFVPQYDVLPPSEPFLRAGTDAEPEAVPGEPTPLYVARTVQNGDGIKAWAEGQGLPVTVEPEDMHITTAYSREPVDVANAPADTSGRATRGPVTGTVQKFNDALVIEFPPDTLGLSQDHQKYLDAGGTTDYDTYRPHVTIAYDVGDVDVDAAPEFSGELRVGPEDQRQLADDGDTPGGGGPIPAAARDVDVEGRPPRPDAPLEAARAQDLFGAVQDAADPTRTYVAPPPVRESWAATIQRKMNTPGRDDSFLNKLGRFFEKKVFTDQAGLIQIERKLGVGGALVHEGMSRLTQMLTNEQSRVNLAFYHAPPKWDKEALVMRADNGVKPLADIFRFNGAEDYTKFSHFAYARRDEGLIGRGKEPRIVDRLREEWLDVSAEDKARYEAMLNDYRDFNDSMLNLMEDASLISKEQKAALQEDGEYVPMFRVFDDAAEFGLDDFFGRSGGLSHPDPGIRALKEKPLKIGETTYKEDGSVAASGGNFGDLLSNIQKSTAAAIMAANQNIAHQRIYDFMSGKMAHESGEIEQATGVRAKTLSDIDKKTAQRSGETDAVMFYRNGQPVYWRLEGDPEMTGSLMIALSGLKPEQMNSFDHAAQAFQNFQGTMITSRPNFAVASLQRDIGQAYIQSGTRPDAVIAQTVRSFADAFTGESQDMIDLMMGAGVGAYQYQAERDVRTQDILQRSGGARRTAMDRGRQALMKYERAIGSTEVGVRKAVYDNFISRGFSEADAMYEARNHLDYGRKGSSKFLRRYMRLLLFVNPRIQGNYRIFERTTGDNKKRILALSTSLGLRGLLYMGLSLGLRAAIMADEDDEQAYQDIPIEERARALHFPIPGSGRFFRWEHAFELGALFGSAPTQIFDQIRGASDAGDSGRLFAHTFSETFALNPTPEIIKPIVEVALNRSFFRGMPIEGMGLAALPKEERANARTGGIAKALGNEMLSPVEIQELMQGYLGPLGMHFYDVVEQQMANMGVVDPKTQREVGPFAGLPPTGRMTADFFAGRFFSKTDRERNVAATREFFQYHRKIREATAFINLKTESRNFDEAREFVRENPDLLKMKRTFNAAENAARKLRRKIRITMDRPDLSRVQKEKAAGEMQYALNQIYRGAVAVAEDAGMDKGFLAGALGR